MSETHVTGLPSLSSSATLLRTVSHNQSPPTEASNGVRLITETGCSPTLTRRPNIMPTMPSHFVTRTVNVKRANSQKENIRFSRSSSFIHAAQSDALFSIRVSFFSAKTTNTTITTTKLQSPSHEIALRFSVANTLSQYRKESHAYSSVNYVFPFCPSLPSLFPNLCHPT
ncbi:hypothetical protein VNO80_07431 [Phaseolus coccineus]|uniref:Uncharacterized protein n=1 Tax=Phaseolus coccineus TaxID=3886 RepID=A0AAN9NNP6_PHACN